MEEQGAQDPHEKAGDQEHFISWFIQDTHWSRAALPLAAGLLLVSPLVRKGVTPAVFAVYLQLPVYMVHQYEEHGHGAFKREINSMLPSGASGLTDAKIAWVNLGGVWAGDATALYLAQVSRPPYGLVAPYLALMNGLIHAGAAVAKRRYNPGLWTGLTLLIPAGTLAARRIARESKASRVDHAIGIGLAAALHVATFRSAYGRKRASG